MMNVRSLEAAILIIGMHFVVVCVPRTMALNIGTAKETVPRQRRSSDVRPVINFFHVESRVTTRFAETIIRSDLENPTDANAQAQFMLYIPETAFISNFSMLIDGIVYIAKVKSKEDAQRDFDDAISRNVTAGQVRSQAIPTERGLEAFAIDVNIKATSSIHFQLDYQQLLQRRFGLYENRISIRPNQIVDDLRVDVYMYESQGIRQMTVIEPLMSNSITNEAVTIDDISDEVKHVTYVPSVANQRSVNENAGIQDDLIIRYDINHDNEIGLLQRVDDYFVHFFSPDENQFDTLSKNILFVIDISGSMRGNKIDQTLEAMLAILDRLEVGDRFMLLLFDDRQLYWPSEQEVVTVHEDSVQAAKNYLLENLIATGSTGINAALACSILKQVSAARGQNMVIFLTDGRPTAGESQPSRIIANVQQAAQGNVAIFSLGFGNDVDFEFLQSLSYRTGGFAQRIYVGGDDVAIQLETFFRQIAMPLIFDVNIIYPQNAVMSNSLTTSSFAQYFSGSELVVSGKVASGTPPEWDVVVTGLTNDPYEISDTVDTSSVDIPSLAENAVTQGFMEKLYVLMKIKDWLKEILVVDGEEEREALKAHALQLALEHQLVTPLTSMIIVEEHQPDEAMADSPLMRDTANARNDVRKSYSSSSGKGSTLEFNSLLVILLYCCSLCNVYSIG